MTTASFLNMRNIPLNNSDITGRYTATGEYIPGSKHSTFGDPNDPILTNSSVYICGGQSIKSVVENSQPVVLTADTRLYFTTNLCGTLHSTPIEIAFTNDSNIDVEANNEPTTTGYNANGVLFNSVWNNKTDTNVELPKGKLFVKNATFYLSNPQ